MARMAALIIVCVALSLLNTPEQAQAQLGDARVVSLAVEMRGGTPIRGVLNPKTVITRPGSGEFTINAVAVSATSRVATMSARHFAQGATQQFGYSSDFSKYNIHIEYDDKYTRQGGGSGAAADALLLVAALSGRGARQDLAITGDMTQLGQVKEVAGIRLKLEAARAAGMRTVIIPEANELDVPQFTVQELTRCQIITASNMGQLLFHGLISHSHAQYWAEHERAIALFNKEEWSQCADAMSRLLNRHPEDLSMYWLWEHARDREQMIEQNAKRIMELMDAALAALEIGDALASLATVEQTLRLLQDMPDKQQVIRASKWTAARDKCWTQACEMAAQLGRDEKYFNAIQIHAQLAAMGYNGALPQYRNAQERYVAQQQERMEQLIANRDFATAETEMASIRELLPEDDSLDAVRERMLDLTVRVRLATADHAVEIGDLQTADRTLRTLVEARLAEEPQFARIQSRLSLAAKQRADALVGELRFPDGAAYYEMAIRNDRSNPRVQLRHMAHCPRISAWSVDAADHVAFVSTLESTELASHAVIAVSAADTAPLWRLTAARFLLACGNLDQARTQYLLFVSDPDAAMRPPAFRELRRLLRTMPARSWQADDVRPLMHMAIAETRLSGGDPRAHIVAALLSAYADESDIASMHIEAVGQQHDLADEVVLATGIIVLLKLGDVEAARQMADQLLAMECGPGALCVAACALHASEGGTAGRDQIIRAARRDRFYQPMTSVVADTDTVFTVLIPLLLEEWFPEAADEDVCRGTAELIEHIGSIVSGSPAATAAETEPAETPDARPAANPIRTPTY